MSLHTHLLGFFNFVCIEGKERDCVVGERQGETGRERHIHRERLV